MEKNTSNELNKKNVIWLIIILIILTLITLGIYIYNTQNQEEYIPNIKQETNVNTVFYYCDQGSIKATYNTSIASTSSVNLEFQNGNIITLPQTVSGSGIRYENNSNVFVSKSDSAFLTQDNVETYTNCVSGNIDTNQETNTFTDTGHIFSFSYPNKFILSGGELGYTVNWAQQSTSTGLLITKVVIPKDFMPNTNFGDAKFTVGTSADPSAVTNCLIYNLGNVVSTTKITIGSQEFTKINFTDAGAGNFYETTSYRTIYNNQCYAIEYTIHSTNIENYSHDQGITEFDKSSIVNIFEGIINSFKFL